MTDPTVRRPVAPTGAARFRATRDQLVGDRALFGSAEIARTYCGRADRVISVVAVTPRRIRRVDCWLGGAGLVAHAASADPTRALLGSVCDRDRAAEMIGSIIESLVGDRPTRPTKAPVELGVVRDLTPDTLGVTADWVVIVSTRDLTVATGPERVVLAGHTGGLALTHVDSLDARGAADPAWPDDLARRLDDVLGAAPRSIEQILADD